VHHSPFASVSLAALVGYSVIWLVFWWPHRKSGYFFFDPQDCAKEHELPPGAIPTPQTRLFPLSAKNATFLPFLEQYVGVTKLMVTIAAASIAFGGDKAQQPVLLILIAKLLLAWSILFGVFFCIVLLWRYDEYAQNMKSYTKGWYSTVFASGFAGFTCFIAGYICWGWGLSG
jgi:hypothetical protein